MKGNFLKVALLGLLSMTAYSGTMGPIATPSIIHSFISAEGGYTWNRLDGLNFNVINQIDARSRQKDQGGSGRLAAGFIKEINEIVLFSGEIGYGYYGKTNVPFRTTTGLSSFNGLDSASFRFKESLDGFDALAGFYYNQPKFDLFFKAGALVQNAHVKFRAANAFPRLLENINIKNAHTEALPEIKLGGSYHLCEHLSLTASWTHAFGSDTQIRTNFNPTTGAGNIHLNAENPTLDVAFIGLQYQFI